MKLWIWKNKVLISILIFLLLSISLLSSNGFSVSAAPIPAVSAQTISTCLNRENLSPDDWHWIYIPELPDELYSDEVNPYLAGELIRNRAVDASACPSGGLALDGWANACGLAVATPTVIIVQNLFKRTHLAGL